MNKNVGKIDRVMRLIGALIIFFLFFTGELTGLRAIILFFGAIILLFTGVFAFCPVYRLLRLSSKKNQLTV